MPNIPPAIDVVHRGRVVVVGPHADRVRPGAQPVRVALPVLDVGVLAGETRNVGAVRTRRVVHAVEVHRVGVMAQVVEVLEVHAEAVADPSVDQRPRDQQPVRVVPTGVVERVPPVGAVAPVDHRGEDRIRPADRHAHDRVVPVRDDVPPGGHGGHPHVHGARRGGRRREQRHGAGTHQSDCSASGPHVATTGVRDRPAPGHGRGRRTAEPCRDFDGHARAVLPVDNARVPSRLPLSRADQRRAPWKFPLVGPCQTL